MSEMAKNKGIGLFEKYLTLWGLRLANGGSSLFPLFFSYGDLSRYMVKKDRVVIVLNVLHLVAQVMQVQTINKASINYEYFT